MQYQRVQVLVLFLDPLGLLLLVLEQEDHVLDLVLLLLLLLLDRGDLGLDLLEFALESLHIQLVMLHEIFKLQTIPLNLLLLILLLSRQLLQILRYQQRLVPQLLILLQFLLVALICFSDFFLRVFEIRHIVVPEYVHLKLPLTHLAYDPLDQRIPIKLLILLLVISILILSCRRRC